MLSCKGHRQRRLLALQHEDPHTIHSRHPRTVHHPHSQTPTHCPAPLDRWGGGPQVWTISFDLPQEFCSLCWQREHPFWVTIVSIPIALAFEGRQFCNRPHGKLPAHRGTGRSSQQYELQGYLFVNRFGLEGVGHLAE